jgi:hypothetical protein
MNLLYPVFSNLDDTDIKNAEIGMMLPDCYYHPPLVTDVSLPNGRLLHNQGPSYSLVCSNRSIHNYRTFMFVLFRLFSCFFLTL